MNATNDASAAPSGECGARLAIRFAGGADVAALHALIERAYRGDSARRGWTHEADLLADERTNAAELRAPG